jgi:hypothetical protein
LSEILAFIAVFAAGMYGGSTAYLALVEHPARLACATEMACAQWTQSVRRTPWYAATALVGAAAGLIQGRAAIGSPWTWGSALLLAVVPYTVVTMLPAQRRLGAPTWNAASVETRTILRQWGRRHATRAVFGVVAFALFLWVSLSAGAV